MDILNTSGRLFRSVLCVSGLALSVAACSEMPSLPRPGSLNLSDMRAPSIQAPNLSLKESRQHGYMFSQQQLEQVPIGASKDQVDFVLGTPSTTGTFDGEVYKGLEARTLSDADLAWAQDYAMHSRAVMMRSLTSRRMVPAGNRAVTWLA